MSTTPHISEFSPSVETGLPGGPAPQWEGEADLPSRLADPVFDHATAYPERPAIGDGIQDWSYSDLASAVRSAAAFLKAHAVQPGDRVMLVGENGLVLAAFILACGLVDACAVLENARRAPLEVEAIGIHAQPRLAIFTSGTSPEAAMHGARASASKAQLPLIGSFLYASRIPELPPLSVDGTAHDVGFLIYTTGTTGTPKGVMLTHRNLLYLGAMMMQLRSFSSDDRVYGVLPITHVMGLAVVFGATLRAGGYLRLAARFSSADCIRALQCEEITVLQGAPAMFAKLADHARSQPFKAPALRYMGAGGAPVDKTIKTSTEALFGLPLHNGYGLTEGSALCWTRLDAPRDDCSVGLPLPGVELRLLSPEGMPVADGQIGELWARGPNVMKGYYRDEESTSRATRPGGWFNTQDLARFDLDGNVYIEGRTKDLIITNGFNVYPLEVENALNSHPAVVHSAVLGRDLGGNEAVIAFVELSKGVSLTSEELVNHLSARLSPYKRPRDIYVMDAIPTSPNGKVLKHRLKMLAQMSEPEGVRLLR